MTEIGHLATKGDCSQMVEYLHATERERERERETTRSETPNLEEKNVLCQVLHKFKSELPVLFELALKLSSHTFIYRTTAGTTTRCQNGTNCK